MSVGDAARPARHPLRAPAVRLARRTLGTLGTLVVCVAVVAACASRGEVAPRTLTVEVSRAPNSTATVSIVILPVKGSGSPAGDPVVLGLVRARDLASFEFDTDRMGPYRLYATSGHISVVANQVRISGARGPDHTSSRIFYIRPDTERIIWDLATERLLVR